MVLGVLGEVLGVLELPDDEEPEPIDPELEPVLPAPLLDPEPMLLPDPVVLPEPLLPYCFTQSSRSVPVLPAHWLGSAALSVLELPLAPEPVVAAGLLLEPPRPPLLLPEELPELCAHDVLARPSNAAATAAVSVFAITMFSP